MSLINDALKRTKDVQQSTPSAATGPSLRPADPSQSKAGSGAKTLLFFMVLAVIVGNFLLWLAFKDRGTRQAKANSTVLTTELAASVPAPAAVSKPAAEPPTAAPKIAPTEPIATQSTTNPTLVAEESAPAAPATNTTAPESKVVFTEPARPTVLRLQSIIYGSRPSAMIGGKFLFVGDSIQGHQVVAIDKETVTLVGEGQTNVLSLP
jgi:hypothetical protein